MNTIAPLSIDRCWNTTGVAGDRSCPELSKVIHCRNCSVHAAAGRSLLDRAVPENYLQEWANLRVDAPEATDVDTLSVVIFRLEAEWLALPALIFKEVTLISTVHTLPHRSNAILKGLVNIRGELQLCVSLSSFLGLETSITQTSSRLVYQRMVVVEKEGSLWVFPVDELYGVQRINSDQIQSLPDTVSKAKDTYTRGILRWETQSVSYLDDDLLFYSLSRRVLG